MARRRGRAMSAGRLIKSVIVAAAALALACLVLLVSGSRALPPLGLALDPGQPRFAYAAAAREFLERRGTLSDEAYQRVLATTTREPLASDPLNWHAMRALQKRDIAAADRLLTEALRRDPRNRMTHLLMLETHFRAGRIDAATRTMTTLIRLVPQARDVLVQQLARLSLDPETREAVLRTVGADPLFTYVLDYLASQNAQPELLLSLGARQPPLALNEGVPAWRFSILAGLVEDGRVEQAYAVWRSLAGAAPGPRPRIYDASFRGLPGPPPFNWELAEGEIGVAERVSGDALEVTYFGRQSGPLASQLIMLSPGTYQLRFSGDGSANGEGSRIFWRIGCRRDGAELLQLPIEVTSVPREFAAQFTVPASDCPGQWLQILGAAAEFPTTQSVRITNLSIQTGGRRR